MIRAISCVGCVLGLQLCLTGCQKGQEKNFGIEQQVEKEDQISSEHYEHLKQLAWLIGTWEDVDETDDVRVETTNDWETHRNFIIQDFKVQRGGREEMSGQQIIGWDPHLKALRSWVFDTYGGFAEGLWHKIDENWVLEVIATLPDGNKASATYLFSDIKPDSYTWEANDRRIGDELLEDVKPIQIKRKKS